MALGTALRCLRDLPRRWDFVSEAEAVAYALARRYILPRGGLPWDPDAGTNLRDYTNGDAPLGEIELSAKLEAEKEERVEYASVTAVRAGNGVRLSVIFTTDDGEHRAVIALSQLTIDVLEVQ